MIFSMKCTCGHVMKVDGTDRNDAVAKMKAMMTEEAIKQHMDEMHKGEALWPKAQVDMMIEQNLMEGDQTETAQKMN